MYFTDETQAFNFILHWDGESADELFVTLDGLPLIEPYHLKDLGNALSIVDLASLGQAELIAGGPSAEYGNQLAGVFKLQTVEPRTDRVRTSTGISITNVRAMRGMYRGGDVSLVSSRWVETHIHGHGSLGDLYPDYDGGDIWSRTLGRVRGIKEGDSPSFLSPWCCKAIGPSVGTPGN